MIQASFAAILPTTGTLGVVVKLTFIVALLVAPFGVLAFASFWDEYRHVTTIPRGWLWCRRIFAVALVEMLLLLLWGSLIGPRPTHGVVLWFLALGFVVLSWAI